MKTISILLYAEITTANAIQQNENTKQEYMIDIPKNKSQNWQNDHKNSLISIIDSTQCQSHQHKICPIVVHCICSFRSKMNVAFICFFHLILLRHNFYLVACSTS